MSNTGNNEELAAWKDEFDEIFVVPSLPVKVTGGLGFLLSKRKSESCIDLECHTATAQSLCHDVVLSCCLVMPRFILS